MADKAVSIRVTLRGGAEQTKAADPAVADTAEGFIRISDDHDLLVRYSATDRAIFHTAAWESAEVITANVDRKAINPNNIGRYL